VSGDPHKLHLTLLAGEFVICRLQPDEPVPIETNASSALLSITRTTTELSIVCAADVAPKGGRCEPGWKCLAVRGPLPFSASGILASLAASLAEARVPIFALSTFDTDYLLVREADLDGALAALTTAGHEIER
jgi:hypothetical protein